MVLLINYADEVCQVFFGQYLWVGVVVFEHLGELGKCDVLLLFVHAFKATSFVKRGNFVTDICVFREQIAPQFLTSLHEQVNVLLIAVLLIIQIEPHCLLIDSLQTFVV